MSRKPSTYAEAVGALLLIAALCLGIYFAWGNGAYFAVAVTAALALLFLWGLVDMLRQGIRQPTAFERFEQRYFMRVILIMVGGGAALAMLKWAGYDMFVVILLPFFLAASLNSASKLRGKDETSAGYKARTGYRDPEQQKQDDSDAS